MEGVILFADDLVFNQGDFESMLFNKIRNNGFPVLPLNNLNDFKETIKSISTYKAIILDWEFIEMLEEQKITRTPLDILEENDLFCLIFIYSYATIGSETQAKLKRKYNNKIQFLAKIKDIAQIDTECDKIFTAISEFETANSHLITPFIWSNTINKSVQNIFHELEIADKYWIKDLYYSSYTFDKKSNPIEPPPVDPNIQVITLFQNLLAEKLIQNITLTSSIEKYSQKYYSDKSDDESLKNLYRRLYYTPIIETDAIMTGDVYKLGADKYGIIISPECDMQTLVKKNAFIEVLSFKISDFNLIDSILNIKKEENRETVIHRAYNQEHPRIHLLPNFKTETSITTALIDFRFSLELYYGLDLDKCKDLRPFKINSPYIQQLRQRYLSYIGRVGVPAIPKSIRITNL